MVEQQNKYVIHTVASAPREGVSINSDGPHILINDARDSQNLLGILPVEHPREPSWACIMPLQQPQGTYEGASWAGMNTPVVDEWCTIDQLSHDLLAPNMRFVLQHLEEPGSAVGFNYSPDPRTRLVDGIERAKFKPNSWDHFHMHWMAGIDSAVQEVSSGDKVTIQAGRWSMDVRPHRYLSEILPHVIEDVLDQEYQNPELKIWGLDAHIIPAAERKALPYAPEGGITFSLPEKIYADPANLSQAMKDIHEGFTKIHHKIWNIFVANYDEVQMSEWTLPYVMRPQKDISNRLQDFSSSDNIRSGMTAFFSLLRPEAEIPNTMNWLYKGPSHSMAVYKHEANYILSLLPHLMHPTNWLAALGIFEVRQAQTADLGGYRVHALAHANKLGATVLPSMTTGLE